MNEQFMLHPYGSRGAFGRVLPGEPVDEEFRQKMAVEGAGCIRQTLKLTEQIFQAEQGLAPFPEVNHSIFTDSIPNIVGSCLARARKLFPVKLYGCVFMSNHMHLLIEATANNFTKFMAYLNGRIACEVNRFLGRKYQFWSRRYALGPVLDEPAELERLLYILMNPEKAGLVDSIEQWQGISSAPFLLEGQKQRFLRFDRTSWHLDRRPDNIAPYLSTVELEHDVLPQLQKYDIAKRKAFLQQRLIEERRALAKATTTNGNDDGTKQTRRRADIALHLPTDRPIAPKRSRAPICHTTIRALYGLFVSWFREFVRVRKECAHTYMNGDVNVAFPMGAFAPSAFPLAKYPDEPDGAGLPLLTRRSLYAAAARDGLVA